MIRMVGGMVGANERAEELVGGLETRLAEARRAECVPERPRVFFEEWDDPLISAIGWVSELVEIAGGIAIFARSKRSPSAPSSASFGSMKASVLPRPQSLMTISGSCISK